jgi:hypothetical protein
MEKSRIFKIVLFVFIFSNVYAQDKPLEEKALEYFCNNIKQINKDIVDLKIKFSGKTQGLASDAFDIADCIGKISFIKDSIPNASFLDSINNINSNSSLKAHPLVSDCEFFRKRVLDNRSYKLSVFNAIEIYDNYYVELYLVNKKRSSWVFCIKFDKKNKEPIGYCLKYLAF